MRIYRGERTIDGIKVTVDGNDLNPRYDLKRLSATGFEWTYEGQGPAQLALALLADYLEDDERALRLYLPFMREIVANFGNEWQFTEDDMAAAVAVLDQNAELPGSSEEKGGSKP